MTIKENFETLKKQIPPSISIVAATKSQPIEKTQEAIDAGIVIIGENYVQEAEKKYFELKGKVKFHFIGHLQKNKVKKAVEIFDLIVIDNEKIAVEINKYAKKIMPVLIEVNIANEPNKAGIHPDQVIDFIKKINNLKNIRIKGLMTLGPNLSAEKLRPYFNKMKQLFDNIKRLNIKNVDMDILSMGMSTSYKIAIEEGATEVRLGTVIFGIRENSA